MIINAGAYRFKKTIEIPTSDIVGDFNFTVKKFYKVLTQDECDYFQNNFGVEIAPGLYSAIFNYSGMRWQYTNDDTSEAFLNYVGRSVECNPYHPALETYLSDGTTEMFRNSWGWESNHGEDNSVVIIEEDVEVSAVFYVWFTDNTSAAKTIKAGTYRFKNQLEAIVPPEEEFTESLLFTVPGGDFWTNDLTTPGAVTTCTLMHCNYFLGYNYFSLWYGIGDSLLETVFPVYCNSMEEATGLEGLADWDGLYLVMLLLENAAIIKLRGAGQIFTVVEDVIVSDIFESWFNENIDTSIVDIYYDNCLIASLYNGQKFVDLKCEGKAMKDNVKIEINEESGLVPIDYNGEHSYLEESSGLAFSLNNDATGYEVSGIGECEDEYIVIPSKYSDLPVVSIGSYAFEDNRQIKGIVVPNSVISIENTAFSGCKNLYSVDCSLSSVESIGQDSFANCNNLIEVKFSNSLKQVGSSAFSNCSNLKTVILGRSVETIESRAFNSCSSLSEIRLSYGLTSIGWDAFYNCTNLSHIRFPDTVVFIGSGAFNWCSALSEIILPPLLTSLEQDVFAHCKNLEKVVMGDNITAMWRVVFWDCQKLTDIKMSESIEHIHGKAFGQCPSLTNLSMPDSIKYTVGDPDVSSGNLFEGSPNIVFNIKDNVKYLGNDDNPYALLFKSTGGSTIQPGTKCIGGYAFKNIPMTSITIPDSVHGISQCAFGESGLTSIYLPNSIEYLDKDAFADSVEGGGYIPNYTIKDIYVPWSEGAIPDAPWGASDAVIHYNSEV